MIDFGLIKQHVTARQAAETYGLTVRRSGMARCPFHDDKTPSLKLDERYPGGRNDPLIGTTKTKSGVRDIPIIPDLLRYLKPFGKGKFVVGEGQTPITMSVTRRRMERINRVINMHGATAHVFRHSFATMLNDAGASVKTIQSIIGQSDFKTTADRYCHARDSSKQEAVRDLTALLTSN